MREHIIWILLFLSSCGIKNSSSSNSVGDEFTGTYRIISHIGNDKSCMDPLIDLQEYDFFRFELAPYKNGMAVASCGDNMCKDKVYQPHLFFPDFRDQTWQGDGIWGSSNFEICDLSYVANVAKLEKNSVISIVSKRFAGSVVLDPPDVCNPDRVQDEKYRKQLNCKSIEKISGELL